MADVNININVRDERVDKLVSDVETLKAEIVGINEDAAAEKEQVRQRVDASDAKVQELSAEVERLKAANPGVDFSELVERARAARVSVRAIYDPPTEPPVEPEVTAE